MRRNIRAREMFGIFLGRMIRILLNGNVAIGILMMMGASGQDISLR
jgi:hypothetical protein